MRLRLPNSGTNVHADQPGRARPRHEAAGPVLIKILFVTPEHLEPAAIRLVPDEPIINMSFPRGRMTAHEIDIQWRGPAQHAALDLELSFVAGFRLDPAPVPSAYRLLSSSERDRVVRRLDNKPPVCIHLHFHRVG